MRDAGSMSGQRCVITGGTAGIGAATARALAGLGARVVLVGRSDARCRGVAQSIRQTSPGAEIETLAADLSSQAEVRRLAAALGDRPIHVLIHNVGAIFELRRESVDGLEMTIALNHLAPFLLTDRLLPNLNAGAPARIIVVSSSAHADVPGMDFEDLQAAKPARWRGEYPKTAARSAFYALLAPWKHPAFLQYAHTKLANMLFVLELSRRLAGSGVTVNSVHPGLVATRFSDGPGVYMWFMRQQARFFGRRPEEGARTIVDLASLHEFAGVTGGYFVEGRRVEPSAAALDHAAAARLWDLSARLTGLRA